MSAAAAACAAAGRATTARGLVQRAGAGLEVRVELLAEALHDRAHRHRAGVAERAQALALDVVADLEHEVDLALLGDRRARSAAACRPSSACPRGRACTCRTSRAGRTRRCAARAAPCRCGRRSRSRPPSRPSCRPRRAPRARSRRRAPRAQHRRRRAARDDRLQRAAFGHAAAEPSIRSRSVVSRAARSCPGRCTWPDSDSTRVPSTARCRSRVLLGAPQDGGDGRERLDVVEQRRALEGAGDGRERRLGGGLAAPAVERGEAPSPRRRCRRRRRGARRSRPRSRARRARPTSPRSRACAIAARRTSASVRYSPRM